ncbi:glycosyltransferase, partial [bacterium]|nr:glycosyltransferase [bacterium]
LDDKPATDFPFTYVKNPPQDKLLELYGCSHIFLSSSKEEGFSLPVLEAMACGCAVVTTDSGGVREMAKDGETALIVAPGNSKGLATKVIELIENREKREGIAVSGLKKAKEFSLKEMTDRLESLFIKAKETYDGRERGDWLAWERALLLCPDDPYANYMLGVTLFKQEEIKKAKEKFKQAISCSPDFDLPYYKLGQLYFEQNDFPRARQNLEKALALNPELKMARRFLDKIGVV